MTINNDQSCYHCGSSCDGNNYTQDSRIFCCSGCQTVYNILKTNDLENYYTIEKTPGISQRNTIETKRFDWLDNTEILQSILEFKEGETSITTLKLPDIHCSSCIWLLEKLPSLLEGIQSVRTNFIKKEARIVWNHEQTSLADIAHLLTKIGYTPDFSFKGTEKKKKGHQYLLKLGVAGFGFGNVMLLTFPDYISASFSQSEFAKFFGFIAMVLSLPVVFYSGSGYLRSALAALKAKTINLDVPISLGIFSLLFFSAYEVIFLGRTGYFDSLTGLILFLLIGKYFQQKSFDQLNFERDYKSYFPLSATTLFKGEWLPKPLKELKKGDRILIRNKEIVPADGILMQSHCQVDYSFVTGEKDLIPKVAGEIIQAGGQLYGGTCELEITKTPSQSYLTQLWNNPVFEKKKDSRLESWVKKTSHYFTIAIIIIALATFGFWALIGLGEGLKNFTAVLIIACPCALALSIPFVYGNAMRLLGRRGIYLKNLKVIEEMAHVDQLVLDKTGTLTSLENSGIKYSGQPISDSEKREIKSVLRNSTHPLSRKLAETLPGDLRPSSNFREIAGNGITGTVGKNTYKLGTARFTNSPVQNDYSGSYVHINRNGNWIGYFEIKNDYREGVLEELTKLNSITVLSGDNDAEREFLTSKLGNNTSLLFNQTPFNKLEYVNKLQEEGKQVMMVGDGLNDSGALKQAQIGVAITDDISRFTPSSDIIMEGHNLESLSEIIRFAKKCHRLVWASFTISFLYNIVGLSFAVTGNLSPVIAAILMPVSSISVVAFALISTKNAFNKLAR